MSPEEALGGESTTSHSDNEGERSVPGEGRRRRRRTRSRTAKSAESTRAGGDSAPEADSSSQADAGSDPKPARPKTRRRARAKTKRDAPAEKDARGTTGTDPEVPAEKRPARSRRRTRAKSLPKDAAPTAAESASGQPTDESTEGERPARSRRRPRRRKAASRSSERERELEREREREPEPEAVEDGGEAGADAPASASEGGSRRSRRKSSRGKKTPARRRKSPEGPHASADKRAADGPEEVADASGEPEDVEHKDAPAAPAEPVEKILLINASDPEEVRIVLLEDGQVEELYIEGVEERTATGNIYLGRVQNVEQAIGAAFVELGKSQTGFLHVSDLADREPGSSITDLVEPGQEVVVQITRDSVGKKGPALSGRISLAGRYLVLMANTDRSGVSRRIGRGRQRDVARRLLNRLEPPEGMGLIIRTAGEGGGFDDLKRDLDHLVAEWEALQARAQKPGAPGLLRAESDLAERSVRDIMPTDVSRIVTDREEVAVRIRSLLQAWYGPVEAQPTPDLDTEAEARDEDEDDVERDPDEEDADEVVDEGAGQGQSPIPEVQVHTELMPLFHAHGAEPQLEEAFRRVLRLPSGGSVVIDPTEALVSIDVNSGRSTDEKDPDATALQTNLEAVEVIARQLRLRDLGGLVVVDLIDMRERKNARAVERAFKKALARDRARIRLGRIGPFGCITLSRQRIRQALSRVTHEECPECGGTGRRRHPDGLGLRVLREMRARVARSHGRGGLEARVPKGVHDWIKRHRGRVLNELEKASSGPVRLAVDDRLALDGWAMKGLPPSGKARKG